MSGKSGQDFSKHWKMRSHPDRAGASGLVDFYPDRVSSAVSAGLRKLHPSKPVTSNAVPKAAGQFAPRVCLRQSIGAICLIGGQSLPGAFSNKTRPAPLRLPLRGPSLGSGLRPSADWFSNLQVQSINQTPFAHRFASSAPPRLSARVSPFRARTPVARYALQASGLVCLRQTPGVSGPPRSARYASSGAALASLFKDHPPDPCARDAHPEDVPRAEDGFYRFAAKGTSLANQKPHCTVASLPSRILRSRFAGCDPP